MVQITLGDAQRELFQRYNYGADVAVRLNGVEKVFWAAGAAHIPKNKQAVKHLVNGDQRRENSRSLISKELVLKRFQTNELS